MSSGKVIELKNLLKPKDKEFIVPMPEGRVEVHSKRILTVEQANFMLDAAKLKLMQLCGVC